MCRERKTGVMVAAIVSTPAVAFSGPDLCNRSPWIDVALLSGAGIEFAASKVIGNRAASVRSHLAGTASKLAKAAKAASFVGWALLGVEAGLAFYDATYC